MPKALSKIILGPTETFNFFLYKVDYRSIMGADDQAVTYNYLKILGHPLKKVSLTTNWWCILTFPDVIQPKSNSEV